MPGKGSAVEDWGGRMRSENRRSVSDSSGGGGECCLLRRSRPYKMREKRRKNDTLTLHTDSLHTDSLILVHTHTERERQTDST